MILKRWLVGDPLKTAQAAHERLSKTLALAIFSSNAISSVAYATEEILLVLILAGTAAVLLVNSDQPGHSPPDPHPDHLVPPDYLRVSRGGRRLYRPPVQSRRTPGLDCRRRTDDRLY